jgi:selenocysteine lyase/cysteine desulfurase
MQHNFVSEILSDIFAIQVRSGCFCAGPFSVKLLNLDKEMIEHLT